uniref:Uncharacterized protein n=1 Tax=Takifugu rubripes TaxID=31033 RepID=A0A674P6Q6_TAKRU
MSELAHQAESVAESAPDMTLVLKTLVPTLLVAVVLQLGATIATQNLNLNMMLLSAFDAFFCKVQDVLQYNNFTKLVVNGKNEREQITKNLKNHLSPQKHVRPSNMTKPLSVLLKNVATCIRHHNLHQ